jgi:hypothetical protein
LRDLKARAALSSQENSTPSNRKAANLLPTG